MDQVHQPPTPAAVIGTAIGAGVVGGGAAYLVWQLGVWLGVDPEVNLPGTGVAAMPAANFFVLALISAAGAAGVARAMVRLPKPRRAFTAAAVVVLVVSMLPLLAQPDEVTMATRLLLAATHVVVYLAVVPTTQRLLPE